MTQGVAGIVVALPLEYLSLNRKVPASNTCFARDPYSLICISGMGGENARRGARLLAEHGAQGLLSWGCAGALAPSLQPGDLCIPLRIVGPDGSTHHVDPDWHRRVVLALPGDTVAHTENLLTSTRLIPDAAAKQALGARQNAIAVDMESAAVADCAAEWNLPFLAVRSIADTASMSLPPSVPPATDDAGTVHLSRLLRLAWRHPGQWHGLWRLGRNFQAAVRTLRAASNHLGEGCRLELPQTRY